MKRKTLAVLGVPVVLLLAAACAQQEEPERGHVPAAEEASAKSVAQPAATIVSADVVGSEGVSVRGSVEMFRDAPDTFLLTVMLQGVPAGEHAWHIHRGKCDASNAPVAVALSQAGDEPALTGPLTAAADSTVNGTVAIPASEITSEQLRSGDYSLRVHSRAGPDHGPTIACADL